MSDEQIPQIENVTPPELMEPPAEESPPSAEVSQIEEESSPPPFPFDDQAELPGDLAVTASNGHTA